ncbi:translation elongation factor Ts [Roseivirga sp.]|jgi:elongation factor Ts|uniref:translation elongation factor Ts n=1 Tax=Roseivirga sp. TaxID=1964215 RepID=UPI000D79240D|nr:translation elongation factor Ts [Roseivirga sp.]PWL24785.1 MAG: elongation factor Ts [Roseivirga sp. XM-24bin3]MBO6494677.1 elongation factor Ts [Roseivirga sp.]MBO6662347.1 elongation factor Ts [Roseivirga sp.]MBO6759504.1 elongation factor Ts [Roseivirga sp.]MBO6910291.1 elongation factor Ts [Roseivirga sp.]
MAITATDVNKLRQMTGAGMMDCKKALVEADGDFDKAIEILRKKGQKLSEKRADRETKEGSVFVRTSEDKTSAIIISFTCETDFVAKNDDFQSLGNEIADAAMANKPADLAALNELSLGELTVQAKVTEYIGKIGEKLAVNHYETLTSEQVASYIHSNGKLGVLVALTGTGGNDVAEAGKDVGMQIAAMNPVAVDKDGVDQATIEKEVEIGKEQARAEGKPEQIIEKIAMGKLNKFFQENTLLSQPFVKDSKQSVQQYLDSVNKGMTVTEFKRVAIG